MCFGWILSCNQESCNLRFLQRHVRAFNIPPEYGILYEGFKVFMDVDHPQAAGRVLGPVIHDSAICDLGHCRSPVLIIADHHYRPAATIVFREKVC